MQGIPWTRSRSLNSHHAMQHLSTMLSCKCKKRGMLCPCWIWCLHNHTQAAYKAPCLVRTTIRQGRNCPAKHPKGTAWPYGSQTALVETRAVHSLPAQATAHHGKDHSPNRTVQHHQPHCQCRNHNNLISPSLCRQRMGPVQNTSPQARWQSCWIQKNPHKAFSAAFPAVYANT
jgi:hypothetical protein